MSKPICNTPTDARCPGDGVTECKKCPAEHVQPAGGDVGTLIDQLDDYIARINGDDRGSNATVNELRGHVTQLQAEAVDFSKSYEALAHVYAATQKGFEKMQAERDALKAELRKTNLTNQDFVSQIGDLQSELTKARELLRDVAKTPWMYDVLGSVREYVANQPAPRGYSNIVMTGTSCNQSAPADKGQGQPVGLQHMAVAEDGKLRWMSGRKMQNCELYALPDGSAIRFRLYAEQPAPVAAVMPERKTVKAGLLSESNTHNQGWNACLDELARLNPIKQ